jgi:hypothetical protein
MTLRTFTFAVTASLLPVDDPVGNCSTHNERSVRFVAAKNPLFLVARNFTEKRELISSNG